MILAAILLNLAAPILAQRPSDDLPDSSVFFNAAVKRPAAKADHSAEIEKLLNQMTIEEKVGQMTQLAIDMVATGKDQKVEIDNAKLEKAVVKYGVGSILNVTNQALTLDHWDRIIRPIQTAFRACAWPLRQLGEGVQCRRC